MQSYRSGVTRHTESLTVYETGTSLSLYAAKGSEGEPVQ
jgi:hypothetical protein